MPQPLTGPLVGQHILVTRPAGQAATLMAGIEQLGGRVTHIPFLAIEPASDLVDLGRIAAHLETYRACIFVLKQQNSPSQAFRIRVPKIMKYAFSACFFINNYSIILE